jgi:hypothetical protein
MRKARESEITGRYVIVGEKRVNSEHKTSLPDSNAVETRVGW